MVLLVILFFIAVALYATTVYSWGRRIVLLWVDRRRIRRDHAFQMTWVDRRARANNTHYTSSVVPGIHTPLESSSMPVTA